MGLSPLSSPLDSLGDPSRQNFEVQPRHVDAATVGPARLAKHGVHCAGAYEATQPRRRLRRGVDAEKVVEERRGSRATEPVRLSFEEQRCRLD